jgi:glycine/D-amino acid oxidase-like deaminating enzyme
MNEKIIIIGSGVSGITTALTLQLFGYETEIYTEKIAVQTDQQSHPEFASLFPSASVIPHSVFSDQLEELFKQSQSIFYELRKQSFPGLTIHKHYEIFEFEREEPDYLSWMLNPRDLDETTPRLSDADKVHGWIFDCIFADWPLYFPTLQKLYKKAGGKITIDKLSSDDIPNLPSSTIINCSGLGSQLLFDDPAPHLILRGHLLHKKDTPLITNNADEIISYNYTPEYSKYTNSEGQACDIYCYPRKDGWILGGSRQTGTITADGKWNGKEITSSCYEVNDIAFPSQIMDLNRKLLKQNYGLSLGDIENLTPSVGYRYIRNKKDGLRLEEETIEDKKIYHNYGHGGAGVSLSWGCALEIAGKITSEEIDKINSRLLEKINEFKLN